MYTLLIVDDELWLRKRLIKTIDWKSLGISKVLEADNGEEALSISIAEEPDIIISDINMPLLSGIDLMRSLNESALYPQMIMISGYDRFEYVQSALKLGATDYLLKPIDEKELIKSVQACIETLNKQNHEHLWDEDIKKAPGELTAYMLGELISGRIDPKEMTALPLSWLNISFPCEKGMVISVSVKPASPLIQEQGFDNALTVHQIQERLSDMMQSMFPGSYVFLYNGKIILILFSNLENSAFITLAKQTLDNINKELLSEMHVQLEYACGTIATGFSEIHDSYRKTQVFPLSQPEHSGSLDNAAESHAFHYLDVYSKYDFSSLIAKVRTGDYDAVKKCADQLVHEFVLNTSDPVSEFKLMLFYIRLLDTLFSSCLSQLSTSAETAADYISCIELIDNISTPYSLLTNVHKVLSIFTNQYANRIGKHKHHMIDQIISYIHDNYASPISMKDVANAPDGYSRNPDFFYSSPVMRRRVQSDHPFPREVPSCHRPGTRPR